MAHGSPTREQLYQRSLQSWRETCALYESTYTEVSRERDQLLKELAQERSAHHPFVLRNDEILEELREEQNGQSADHAEKESILDRFKHDLA